MAIDLGGYGRGYAAVPCFWGTSPGSLVSNYLADHPAKDIRVLDVGAGEGKNAAAFASRGAIVDAIECSTDAITNGKSAFADDRINWIEEDATLFEYPSEFYDVVVCYGLLHCLPTERHAERLLIQTQASLRPNGIYLLASFNDGSHDLSAHPDFVPLLLRHSWFVRAFESWDVLIATDSVLYETHPHNNIPHFHSMTRIMAQRK